MRNELSFEEQLADALQRIIAPVRVDPGETDNDGIVLRDWVIVSEWQALDGGRAVHVAWGQNQPEYINKALLNEGLSQVENPDEEE